MESDLSDYNEDYYYILIPQNKIKESLKHMTYRSDQRVHHSGFPRQALNFIIQIDQTVPGNNFPPGRHRVAKLPFFQSGNMLSQRLRSIRFQFFHAVSSSLRPLSMEASEGCCCWALLKNRWAPLKSCSSIRAQWQKSINKYKTRTKQTLKVVSRNLEQTMA